MLIATIAKVAAIIAPNESTVGPDKSVDRDVRNGRGAIARLLREMVDPIGNFRLLGVSGAVGGNSEQSGTFRSDPLSPPLILRGLQSNRHAAVRV